MGKKIMAVFLMCIVVVAALQFSAVADGAGEAVQGGVAAGTTPSSPSPIPRAQKTVFKRLFGKSHPFLF